MNSQTTWQNNINQWASITAIADGAAGFSQPEGFYLRQTLVDSASAIDLHGTSLSEQLRMLMEVNAAQIIVGDNVLYNAAQLELVALMLAANFPSMASLAARAYEAARKISLAYLICNQQERCWN